MATVRISIQDLPKALRERSQKRYAAAVKAIQVGAALHAPAEIQASIDATQPRAPVDRAEYRRSWQTRSTDDGAQVYSTSPYASVIEWGRRPGARMPPVKAIAAWVARKGLVSGRTQSDREGAAAGLAFAIARKIARQGLPAKRVLERARQRFLPLIVADVRDALRKVRL